MLNDSINFDDSELVPLESTAAGTGLVLESVAVVDSNEQATTESVSTESASTEPIATPPVTTEAAASEAVSTEQVADADGAAKADPLLNSPAQAESGAELGSPTTETASTEPIATPPVTTEAAALEPVSTEQVADADGAAQADPLLDSPAQAESGAESGSPTDSLGIIEDIQPSQIPGVTIAQLTESNIYFSMALGQARNANEVLEIANWQEVFGTGDDSAMLYHATHH